MAGAGQKCGSKPRRQELRDWRHAILQPVTHRSFPSDSWTRTASRFESGTVYQLGLVFAEGDNCGIHAESRDTMPNFRSGKRSRKSYNAAPSRNV